MTPSLKLKLRTTRLKSEPQQSVPVDVVYGKYYVVHLQPWPPGVWIINPANCNLQSVNGEQSVRCDCIALL